MSQSRKRTSGLFTAHFVSIASPHPCQRQIEDVPLKGSALRFVLKEILVRIPREASSEKQILSSLSDARSSSFDDDQAGRRLSSPGDVSDEKDDTV